MLLSKIMVGFVVSIACVSGAHADVLLGTLTTSGPGVDAAGGGLGNPTMRPFLSYGDPPTPVSLGYMGGQAFTLLDVLQGNTKQLSGDFANFALLSTNGFADGFQAGFTVDGGNGSSAFFNEALYSPAIPGVADPDFAGYDITRVVVLATSFQSGTSSFSASFEFSVYGNAVPAPGAAGVCVGAALLLTRRRR